jgi:hypothetical protein
VEDIAPEIAVSVFKGAVAIKVGWTNFTTGCLPGVSAGEPTGFGELLGLTVDGEVLNAVLPQAGAPEVGFGVASSPFLSARFSAST